MCRPCQPGSGSTAAGPRPAGGCCSPGSPPPPADAPAELPPHPMASLLLPLKAKQTQLSFHIIRQQNQQGWEAVVVVEKAVTHSYFT